MKRAVSHLSHERIDTETDLVSSRPVCIDRPNPYEPSLHGRGEISVHVHGELKKQLKCIYSIFIHPESSGKVVKEIGH